LGRKESDRSYSRQEVVLQILFYLYNKPDGKSPTDIQERCCKHTQGYGKVNEILIELWKLKVVDKIEISKSRIIYKINGKGRDIVHVSKGLLKDVYFSSIDFDRI
jgi:hypothetical protein